MRKMLIITLFIIIIMIQTMMPIVVHADNTKGKFKLSVESKNNGNVMPYVLYSSPNASSTNKIPLIVYLSGLNVMGMVHENKYTHQEVVNEVRSSGLPAVLENWNLEGFNAYVLCPMIRTGWYETSNNWNDSGVKKNLKKLVDNFKKEHNNVGDVILIGTSSGGVGALYVANSYPGYFNKLIVLCGTAVLTDYSNLPKDTLCICGTNDNTAQRESLPVFKQKLGEDKAYDMPGDHSTFIKAAFIEDTGDHVRNWSKWKFRFN